MKFIKLSLFFLLLVTTNAFSIEVIELSDTILVTDSYPSMSIFDVARNVEIITSQEINTYPVNSVEELLSQVSGIDIQTRGGQGVQSDISIRGGTFEQTLILLNGIKVNDAQTGHHNFNIPVSLHDIERVEIIKSRT